MRTNLIGISILVLSMISPGLADENREGTSFPKPWSGVWKGAVRSQSKPDAEQTFEMQLIIEPDDGGSTKWQIVYDGPQGRSVRDYQLLASDISKGNYILDEKNGIKLPARLLGNQLSFHFSVANQHILTTYRLVGGPEPRIEFDLIASSSEQPLKSGGTGEVPEVLGFSIGSHQHAVLTRDEAATKTRENGKATDLSKWTKLKTDPYRGKQDDLFMVDAKLGWYVNGAGKIYKTVDGGDQWTLQSEKPGTYFRCLGFIDQQHGFAGNIGPDYFPGVTDKTPLYETRDGGTTWVPVNQPVMKDLVGLCSIQVLREKFIDAGVLAERIRLIAVGRVGGPAAMIVSDDLGASWQKIDVDPVAAMLLDVHFFNRDEGFLAAASNRDVAQSHALILSTKDGGKTWTAPWQSTRPFELTWKIAFPSRNVGYVTIQSYNPDQSVIERFVAKTTDGGAHWTELPLITDANVRQFGIAFLNESVGWIGATPQGFFTDNGGKSWIKADIGRASNKIRLIEDHDSFIGFAIGVDVYRIVFPKSEMKIP